MLPEVEGFCPDIAFPPLLCEGINKDCSEGRISNSVGVRERVSVSTTKSHSFFPIFLDCNKKLAKTGCQNTINGTRCPASSGMTK